MHFVKRSYKKMGIRKFDQNVNLSRLSFFNFYFFLSFALLVASFHCSTIWNWRTFYKSFNMENLVEPNDAWPMSDIRYCKGLSMGLGFDGMPLNRSMFANCSLITCVYTVHRMKSVKETPTRRFKINQVGLLLTSSPPSLLPPWWTYQGKQTLPHTITIIPCINLINPKNSVFIVLPDQCLESKS